VSLEEPVDRLGGARKLLGEVEEDLDLPFIEEDRNQDEALSVEQVHFVFALGIAFETKEPREGNEGPGSRRVGRDPLVVAVDIGRFPLHRETFVEPGGGLETVPEPEREHRVRHLMGNCRAGEPGLKLIGGDVMVAQRSELAADLMGAAAPARDSRGRGELLLGRVEGDPALLVPLTLAAQLLVEPLVGILRCRGDLGSDLIISVMDDEVVRLALAVIAGQERLAAAVVLGGAIGGWRRTAGQFLLRGRAEGIDGLAGVGRPVDPAHPQEGLRGFVLAPQALEGNAAEVDEDRLLACDLQPFIRPLQEGVELALLGEGEDLLGPRERELRRHGRDEVRIEGYRIEVEPLRLPESSRREKTVAAGDERAGERGGQRRTPLREALVEAQEPRPSLVDVPLAQEFQRFLFLLHRALDRPDDPLHRFGGSRVAWISLLDLLERPEGRAEEPRGLEVLRQPLFCGRQPFARRNGLGELLAGLSEYLHRGLGVVPLERRFPLRQEEVEAALAAHRLHLPAVHDHRAADEADRDPLRRLFDDLPVDFVPVLERDGVPGRPPSREKEHRGAGEEQDERRSRGAGRRFHILCYRMRRFLTFNRAGDEMALMPAGEKNGYRNPLADRYASAEMLEIFSDRRRYRTWRDLWIALAECEAEAGLPIPPQAIAEMRRRRDDIDFERVAAIENDLRHDVMAHITHYGEQCPAAKPIIHLGATSCYVTDNTDLILMRDGLKLVAAKLRALLQALRGFALEHRSLPALAYTHFQPAQLTTVGKRAAMWAQDFLLDLDELESLPRRLRFRGVKGTTGTQASFLKLFDGDADKVRRLDERLSARMGFGEPLRITGQTYTRKLDVVVLQALAGIGVSAHRFSNDLRLLQGLGETEEPFGPAQVGSSAMPYKRNPMKLERISSLSKFLISTAQNPVWVAATQWLERTLDDSANRRIAIPEAFLAADAVLILANSVVRGLVVNSGVIRERTLRELEFMATEDLLMEAVKAGGDRQALHEKIRGHSMAVIEARRRGEKAAGLLDRIAADPSFAAVRASLGRILDPARYVGRAPEQVEEFFREEVDPRLAGADAAPDATWEVRV